jgi:DNA-binding transcriptional ArsR family regulator
MNRKSPNSPVPSGEESAREPMRHARYGRREQDRPHDAVPRVEIECGPEDLANIRFAFSPLWECQTAFRAWTNPAGHSLLQPWISMVGKKLEKGSWEPLRSMGSVPRGIIPDFLSQPSLTARPRFHDEVGNLLRTPREVVRREVEAACPGGVPRALRGALDDPRKFLAEMAAVLEKFWRRAIEPFWGTMRQKLEGEVLYRAHALAFGGPGDLFRDLHKDVHYRGNRLTIFTRCCWSGGSRRRGLWMMPSIFSWPDVYLTVRPPWRPMLTYPARGIAELWDQEQYLASRGLVSLFGKTRMRVMLQLRSPQTTLGTARVLGLTTATVSEHITKLQRAGILERTRLGRSVFYTLNDLGSRLLAVFHAAPGDAPRSGD